MRPVNVREIRRQRLLELLAEHGGSKAELARAIGKAPAQVSQWVNQWRTIAEDTAREIERKTGKPPGWLDAPLAGLPAGEAQPIGAYIGTAAAIAARWPFPRIDQAAVLRLTKPQIRDLEAAMLLTAAHLGLTIGKRRAA